MKRIATMITAGMMAMMMTVPAFPAVSAEQAKQIALRQAGVNPSSVNYMRVKEDWDNGHREYEVEFYVGRTEYSVDVDLNTGTVTDFDVDFD